MTLHFYELNKTAQPSRSLPSNLSRYVPTAAHHQPAACRFQQRPDWKWLCRMGGKQQTAHIHAVRNDAQERACFVSNSAVQTVVELRKQRASLPPQWELSARTRGRRRCQTMPSLNKTGKFATVEDEVRRYLGLLLEIALQHTTTLTLLKSSGLHQNRLLLFSIPRQVIAPREEKDMHHQKGDKILSADTTLRF